MGMTSRETLLEAQSDDITRIATVSPAADFTIAAERQYIKKNTWNGK